MKIRDIAKSAKAIVKNVNAYFQFRLYKQVRTKDISGYGLIIWSILFFVMTTKLLDLAGIYHPMREFQRGMDERNATYQVVVVQDRLGIEKIAQVYPPKTRPIVKRIDIFTFDETPEVPTFDWWENLFFLVGYQKITLVALPVDEFGKSPTGIIAQDKSALESQIDLLKEDHAAIVEIQRDQDTIRNAFLEEVRIGFGFVRLAFEHISFEELSKNEAFMLVFLLLSSIASVLTFHFSAKIFNSEIRIIEAVDLGLRNFGIWFILIVIMNLIGSVIKFSDVYTPLLTVIFLFVFALFLAPSLYSWKKYYNLTWLKFVGVIFLCIPSSVIPGIFLFCPIMYTATVYHDVFDIFI
ncbi:hypothetical protein KA005_65280 [bacterium]|nr:hypothetical protein [bacterium]